MFLSILADTYTPPAVPDADAAVQAMTDGVGGIASDAMSAIGAVLPYALAVVGAILVISIGYKAFKKFTGR